MINLPRRWRVPGSEFGIPLTLALFGFLLFSIGIVLSFRVALRPFLAQWSESWNAFSTRIVGADNASVANHTAGGLLLLVGFGLLVWGVRSMLHRFLSTLNPTMSGSMAANYWRKVQLARGPRIVVLGGGTGLSTLLRGLKRYSSNITAIVTVSDDGGSSGRLSDELGIIPPGDIRNCLVALADSEKQLTDIFQYRFTGKHGSLSGHSLGNLLIAGLIDLNGGDFDRALTMASDVLAIRGRVIPSTLERVRLRAKLDDGREVCGETAIVASGGRIRRIYLDPADAHPFPEVRAAIDEADLVVIGPGSVYTSIIPNLLVPGIAQSLRESQAAKIYICNVMTQPGESDAFTAAEHVLAIEANVEAKVFSHVLVNTQLPSPQALEKYKSEDQYPVEADIDRILAMGFKVVGGDYMSESDYVRHDPIKLADACVGVFRAR